jgi:hypothetical protein
MAWISAISLQSALISTGQIRGTRKLSGYTQRQALYDLRMARGLKRKAILDAAAAVYGPGAGFHDAAAKGTGTADLHAMGGYQDISSDDNWKLDGGNTGGTLPPSCKDGVETYDWVETFEWEATVNDASATTTATAGTGNDLECLENDLAACLEGDFEYLAGDLEAYLENLPEVQGETQANLMQGKRNVIDSKDQYGWWVPTSKCPLQGHWLRVDGNWYRSKPWAPQGTRTPLAEVSSSDDEADDEGGGGYGFTATKAAKGAATPPIALPLKAVPTTARHERRDGRRQRRDAVLAAKV